jgi:hypothetical protein
MSSIISRILDMLVKVLGFIHSHPFDDTSQAIAVTTLESRAARLQLLVEQEESGHLAEATAKATRDTMQARLLDSFNLLGHLAATATREDPATPVRLNFPRPRTSLQSFLAAGRSMLKEARSKQEVLLKYGLPPQLLDEISESLDQFESAISAKATGVSLHVGANTEIQALASEVRHLVKLIDAFYRRRFRDNQELAGAWKAARTVVRHTPKTADQPADPATAVTPSEPANPGTDAAHPAA